MLLHTLYCNICGAPVGDEDSSWMNEYRALYTNGHRWFVAQLSGVGIDDQDDPPSLAAKAPVDPNKKSPSSSSPTPSIDEDGFVEEIVIRPMTPFLETEERFGVAPLLGEEESSVWKHLPWGFFFHESCWKLFTQVCNPEEFSLGVLMGVFMSFPASGLIIDWGHDYGGIYEVTPEKEPEAGHVLDELRYVHAGTGDSAPELFQLYPLGLANPYPLLEVNDNLLQEDNGATCASTVSPVYRLGSQSDCFTGLPAELREMILCYLPTRDVLNFFLSSRIFACSPLPRCFWTSRFRPDSELASILELDCLSSRPFWNLKAVFKILWKYAQPAKPYRIPNRKRIWDLLLPLADAAICLSNNPTVHGTPWKTFFHPDLSEESLRWRRLGGLVQSRKWFERGCQALFVRTVRVPEVVVGIYVSRIRIGGAGFVTGLRFIDGEGTSTKLGYILQGRELYLGNSKGEVGTENYGLRGFHLAVGMKGIKALAVAMGPLNVLDWAGNPENIPRGRLIPRSGAIRDLKAEFDGIKLISLSIPEEEPGKEITLHQESIPVRNRFAWFPDIPPEHLRLNEQQFASTASGCVTRGVPYRRLFWMHFGGPEGVYLRNVVSISCYFYNSVQKAGIEVQYNTEVEGSNTWILGSRGLKPLDRKFNKGSTTSILSNGEAERLDSEFKGKVTFDIDGPGGEYITAVAVNSVHGLVLVRTNHARAKLFVQGLSLDAVEYNLPAVVEYEVSTAVTGFYVKTDMKALRVGVITEHVS